MRTVGLLAAFVAFLAAGPALEAQSAEAVVDAKSVHVLQAKIKLLEGAIAARDKIIAELRAEPLREEVTKLRQELQEARKTIEKLTAELERLRPVEPTELRITDRDLTPGSIKEKDFKGARLLLDGYVIKVFSDDNGWGAIIVAGEWSDSAGHELLGRLARERDRFGQRIDYQIHAIVRGEIVKRLRKGNPVRVEGIIREVQAKRGLHWERATISHLPPTEGFVIEVKLQNVMLR